MAISRAKRDRVIARDGRGCYYCGVETSEHIDESRPRRLTIDHLLARAQGGRDNEENLVIACRTCNGRKADRLPSEFLVSPRGTIPVAVGATSRPIHTRLHTRADGKAKRAYPDRQSARLAAYRLAKRDRCVMEVFECRECHQWHLRIMPGLRYVLTRRLRQQAARAVDPGADVGLAVELGDRVIGNLKAENRRGEKVRLRTITTRAQAAADRRERARVAA